MIWLFSGIFKLLCWFFLSIVFCILAMIPLVAACCIYNGQWTNVTIQGIISLENKAFAGALGSVLADNPIWNMLQTLLGGISKALNSGIDASVFFADAATLSFTPYEISELIGMAIFMLIWLRVQMDLVSGVLHFTPFAGSVIKMVTGDRSIWSMVLSSISFSISLLGAFFSSVVFNAVRSSAYPWCWLTLVIIAEIILFLGIKGIAGSYSIFRTISIAEEVISGLIKTFTLFVSMYLSYYYFSGTPLRNGIEDGIIIIGWIMGMHGLNGENIWWRLAGLASVIIVAILII